MRRRRRCVGRQKWEIILEEFPPTYTPPPAFQGFQGGVWPSPHPPTTHHYQLPTTHSHTVLFQGDLAALVGGDLPDDDEDDQEDYQEVPQGKKVGVCDFTEGLWPRGTPSLWVCSRGRTNKRCALFGGAGMLGTPPLCSTHRQPTHFTRSRWDAGNSSPSLTHHPTHPHNSPAPHLLQRERAPAPPQNEEEEEEEEDEEDEDDEDDDGEVSFSLCFGNLAIAHSFIDVLTSHLTPIFTPN